MQQQQQAVPHVGNAQPYKRMNFLYQASVLMNETHPAASRFFAFNMKKIAQKNVLRIHPTIKRTLCKTCNSLLVPGQSCTMRIHGKREKHATITCTLCNTKKRYLLRDLTSSALQKLTNEPIHNNSNTTTTSTTTSS